MSERAADSALSPPEARLPALDLAKLAGVFLVVLGHALAPGEVRNAIYTFHIPLFFLISGLVLKVPGQGGLLRHAGRRARSLLLPYVLFCLLAYVWWLLVERRFRGEALDPLVPLGGLLYGANRYNFLLPNPSLWFLPCLFLSDLLASAVLVRVKALPALAAVAAGLFVLGQAFADTPPLPLGLGSVPVGACFILLGFLARPTVGRLLALRRTWLLLLGAFLLCGNWVFSLLNGAVSLDAAHYGSPLLYASAALVGSLGLLCLASAAQGCGPLERLGAGSLLLYGLSDPCRRVFMLLMSRIGGFRLEDLRASVLLSASCAMLCLALLSPLVFLAGRLPSWFPAGTRPERKFRTPTGAEGDSEAKHPHE
jgi:fucose 4-O-acetylase-like acetyltransferase